jgi:hypothetical protein
VPSALCIAKSFDFSVSLAGSVVPAAADDAPTFDQNRTDHRVG